MLSPAARLYLWAKRDRMREEPNFFRTRSRAWRHLMRVEQDADYAPRFRFRGMKGSAKTSRPTWTPWLWVK